ncbi:hypothetical protein BH11VER1_BH11VER1_14300 [soil metagenome]
MDVSSSESAKIRQEAEPAGLRSSLARYLDARAVLLSLEAQEASAHVGKIIIQVCVALIAAFTGWLVLVTALVSVLAHLLKCHWHYSALIVGGINVALALLMVFLIRHRLTSASWFADTLNELKRDREWLTKKH